MVALICEYTENHLTVSQNCLTTTEIVTEVEDGMH
jgi:hypothetical protein